MPGGAGVRIPTFKFPRPHRPPPIVCLNTDLVNGVIEPLRVVGLPHYFCHVRFTSTDIGAAFSRAAAPAAVISAPN
jgi:hypothetical protein